MVALWMVYCLGVSGLLAFAANACERGLRGRGMPIRWVWISAIAGSLLLPVWGLATSFGADAKPPVARTVPQTVTPAPVPVSQRASGIGTAPVTIQNEPALLERTIAAASPVLKALSPGLLVAWVAGSLWMGALLLGGWLRLRTERSGWQHVRVSGRGVMISDRTGPAVVGFVRPGIVLPRWFLKLEKERRELVLLHEEEHLRAHDERLLFFARLALISMPCNVALWYQVQRLRLAVEIDCDARVLRVHPDAREYGDLLLDVGRRVNSGSLQQIAALSEPVSFLARRVDAMMVVRRQSRTAASLALAMAAVVVTIACYTPRPPVAPFSAGPRPGYSAGSPAPTRVDSLAMIVWNGERMTRDSLVRRLYGTTLLLDAVGVLEFVVDSDDVVWSAGVRSSSSWYGSADTTVTGQELYDGYGGVQATDVASTEVDRTPYGFPEITSVIWVRLKPGARVSDYRDRARASRGGAAARSTVRSSASIDSSWAATRAAGNQAASADSLARLVEQMALQMARHQTEAARFEAEMSRHAATARRYYPEIVNNPPASPVTLWFLADTADRVIETLIQRSALGTVGLPEVVNAFPAVPRALIQSWTVTSPFPFGIVWVRVASPPPPR